MSKTIIRTEHAAPPIGPYSQAVKASGNFIFTSGQIPLDASGNFAEAGITGQTHVVFANLKAILAAGGSSFDQVVKCTVFLKDMNDFAAMNEVYTSYFSGPNPPARSTIQVARLPKDALVEIEVVALANQA